MTLAAYNLTGTTKKNLETHLKNLTGGQKQSITGISTHPIAPGVNHIRIRTENPTGVPTTFTCSTRLFTQDLAAAAAISPERVAELFTFKTPTVPALVAA